MGDSVVSAGIPTSNTPDIIENYALSVDFLIGFSDLNSSHSYAIDNLISSRSDANHNSTAMVSVNPDLRHSVKVAQNSFLFSFSLVELGAIF